MMLMLMLGKSWVYGYTRIVADIVKPSWDRGCWALRRPSR